MLRLLKAKMLEKDISTDDIAKLIGKSERTIRDKINEESTFSLPDTVKIRDHYFVGIDLEELFASDKGRETA